MGIEYIIWGIPKDKINEEILISEKFGIKSLVLANAVCKDLEEKHGCKNTRIQIVDLSINPLELFKQSVNRDF